ncbi:DNA repair protein XRCC2 homolog [Momordica charantia]|uniref:DNA repair protein XRCC2 homolog n=1 Tax=Momordica charantia TaxID=3673 RepID=A0A6J1DLP4_MOMCH|nr:DNA repair protein XRCC2 homolog [Momordica charantia]XP_022155176.1 DNA repair protein XRCC2 homolog [Momordica charantia]
MALSQWIAGDETAAEMLARVLKQRPSLFVPPLHRLPLRAGNVVELVGPSGSAKTQILIQAAVNCILPKEWNGVRYGGLECSVVFIDLDCRLDVSRLSQVLKLRILEANGNGLSNTKDCENFNALFATCMRRFLYIRCYDSFEFLATLKTMHHRLQKERDVLGIGVHLLMIDSIGAYHWVDRVSSSLPLWGHNRKGFSLANVLEAVVEEVRKLLLVHPSIAIATKATIFGDKSSDMVRREKPSAESESRYVTTSSGPQVLYREYMPFAWQSFVTHRVFVRGSDEHLTVSSSEHQSIYFSEWLLPSLGFFDKFIVKNAGVFIVP